MHGILYLRTFSEMSLCCTDDHHKRNLPITTNLPTSFPMKKLKVYLCVIWHPNGGPYKLVTSSLNSTSERFYNCEIDTSYVGSTWHCKIRDQLILWLAAQSTKFEDYCNGNIETISFI